MGWPLQTAPGGSLLVYSNVLGADTATLDTGAKVIPSGYNVLEVLAVLRTDEVAAQSTIGLRFNGDTGSNYDFSLLNAVNITASAQNTLGAASLAVFAAAASDSAGVATPLRVEVPGYALTTFNKSGTSISGVPDQTAANTRTQARAFAWRSTVAINQVSLIITSGASQKFKAGSALYVYVR